MCVLREEAPNTSMFLSPVPEDSSTPPHPPGRFGGFLGGKEGRKTIILYVELCLHSLDPS